MSVGAFCFFLGLMSTFPRGQLAQSSLGRPCTRGDGLAGTCLEISRCLADGGSLENVGRIRPCRSSTNANIVVCCRPQTRKIAKNKCDEWSSGGSSGIRASEVVQPHIAGGEEARVGEFPHMVSLMLNPGFKHFCGGSLIAPQFVLTAAHCIVHPLQNIEVRLGAHDITRLNEEGSQRLTVLDAIFPDGYKPPARYHDIVLLRLSREVSITRRIRPICLPYQPNVLLSSLVVSGWGYRPSVNALTSDKLQKADLDYDDQVKCNGIYAEPIYREVFKAVYPSGIPNSIICASKESKDACKGDSGGPLMRYQGGTSGILVGIVSQGSGCPSPIPGTYTRVESYLDWIVNTVWPNQV